MKIVTGQTIAILSSQIDITGPNDDQWFTVTYAYLPPMAAGDIAIIEYHGHQSLHVVPFDTPGAAPTSRALSDFYAEMACSITVYNGWFAYNWDYVPGASCFLTTGHNVTRQMHYDEKHITTSWTAPNAVAEACIQVRLRSRVSTPDPLMTHWDVHTATLKWTIFNN